MTLDATGAGSGCVGCRVHSRRYHLRAFGSVPDDLRFAYQLLTDQRVSEPFRWHGATLSFETFCEELFAPTLIGFTAVSRSTGEPRGLSLVTAPDLRDGHAFLSVVALPEIHGKGLMVEAAIATIAFAFDTWPFYKLYADVDARALRQFSSLTRRGAVEEGRFRGHLLRGDERIDVHRLAIYRDEWGRAGGRLIGGLGITIADKERRVAEGEHA